MNTKDNQEAELSGEAKFHIEVCRAMALINQSIGCVSDANGLEAKNILRLALYDYAPTTPQVNEEVASGEAIYEVYDISEETWFEVSKEYYDMNVNDTGMMLRIVYLHPPTPSPSNVLVEALRELDNWISHGCNRDELDVPRKKARDAILSYEASYSSTDSALPNDEVK